jgi:hypothetical protein
MKLSDETKFNFAMSKSTDELGIMVIDEDIDEEGESITRKHAFFMNRDQFNCMLAEIKKEKPEWLENE